MGEHHSHLGQRRWLLLYLLLACAYASLFVLYKYPPLQDYPCHLLVAKVIAEPHAFAPHYSVHWKPVPNMTNQLFLAGLSKVMDVNNAARLFLALYALVFAAGAFAFARAFLRRDYLAGLLLFLWLPSFFFWRGNTNFILGVALCLLFLGLSKLKENARPVARFGLDALAVLAMYFTHPFPCGTYLLYRAVIEMRDPKRAKYLLMLVAGVAALAVIYLLDTGNGSSRWMYGTGLWKISSIKRLLAISYVSTLGNLAVFTLINVYNLLVYLWFLFCAGYAALRWRDVWLANRHTRGLLVTAALLLVPYLASPAMLGDLEVDSRLSCFMLLFVIMAVTGHVLDGRPIRRKVFAAALAVALGLNLAVTHAQFALAQQRLVPLVRSLRSSAEPRTNDVRVSQYNILHRLAARSVVFRALEPVKLHTDLSQVALVEELADGYFYLDGGYPRRIFTFSIIRENRAAPSVTP